MPTRVWVASTRRTLGDLRKGVRWKLVTRSRQAQPETRTWPAYVTVSQPLGHTVAYGYKDLRFRNSLPHLIALRFELGDDRLTGSVCAPRADGALHHRVRHGRGG